VEKNQPLEDVLIQTTSVVGVVERSAGIPCLVESIRVKGLVTRGFAALVRLKLTAAAIVEMLKNLWSAMKRERTRRAECYRRPMV
jgi:hypothetical protein